MKQITLNIDRRDIRVQEGVTILDAARSVGIYIPTLCSHPSISSFGTCKLCIVKVDGMSGLPTSCNTPAEDGMVIQTHTPEINRLRRDMLEYFLGETQHPHGCLTCPRQKICPPNGTCLRYASPPIENQCLYCVKNQRCELQQISRQVGLLKVHKPYEPNQFPIRTDQPFFNRNYNLCIVCGRCARVCQEVRVRKAISFTYRDGRPAVGTPLEMPLAETDCEFCGSCVDVCPVGALTEKNINSGDITEKMVSTTCPYCGVGCLIQLEIRRGKIFRVRPDPSGQANQGMACVKGRFGITEMVHSPKRLTTPLIRKNGAFQPASWDEALDLIASKFKSYKPDEFGIFAAGKCTNEDNYVMQKFARVVLGTNNVDHCARLCHAPTVTGLAQAFGSGAMTNPISDVFEANSLFVIGSNTTYAHPVIGIKIKQAARQGKKLIVANPLEIELTKFADIWLRHIPGSDVALMMGMCRAIIEAGLEDKEFIASRCENYEEFKASLDKFTPEFVSQTTGVTWTDIQAAARMYAQNTPGAIFYAMGITQSSHGHDNVLATANLSMLTGNIGKPGSGVNPLRGHNNVQGACDMGGLPNVYSGYQSVADPIAREKFEKAWGVKLPPEPGLTLTEFIHDAYQGKIKAIYIMGENISLSEPCVRMCQGALEELDFLVVQDLYLTETAQLAHVVLPACSFAEKDGTYTNTERRVQRVRAALEPLGQSQPDWWIICQLAKRMGGKGFDYNHPREIMEEIAMLTPSYGGISHERLEKEGGLQWPCPTPDHPGTPRLHTEKFTRGKGKFSPLAYRPPAELPDAEYPLMLTTQRSLFHFHTGTMTRKVSGLNVLKPEEQVEINPADAQRLGIQDGELVKVSSRRGELEAHARVTESSPVGLVAMTFHFLESPTNVLTNPAYDPIAKIPEYKVCAVKVEKAKVASYVCTEV